MYSVSRMGCIKIAAAAVMGATALTACSGGGGGSSAAPAPSPPSGPSYQSGEFAPASQFTDLCERPRSGVDSEGNAFPDEQGERIDELFWLRSWTNETYLWNREVTDRNPYDFEDQGRLAYFELLKTEETTTSGKLKDDFHFSEPTEEFLERRNAEPVSGYGLSLAILANTPPRDVRVRYVEPGSPAAEAPVPGTPNFRRGTRILEVDGIDVINATDQADIDKFNAGLFPAEDGETHEFVVEDPDATGTRTVTVTSEQVIPSAVNRSDIVPTPAGDVGYMLLNTFGSFSSEQEIATAISDFAAAGVDELVLDLRYNGGGLLAVASQLGYQVAGGVRTTGAVYERLRFNADAGGVNPVTGESDNTIPFYDTGLGFSLANGTPLDTLNLGRVFVLSTGRTCSASESIINSLRGIDVEVVLIGDTTCGKPFGFYPTDNCGETYYTIQFQGVNSKDFGDYADGFIPNDSSEAFGVRLPGCQVADDFSTELGDETEGLLAAALQYAETGTCPAQPSAVIRSGDPSDVAAGIRPQPKENISKAFLGRANRDPRLPRDFMDGSAK